MRKLVLMAAFVLLGLGVLVTPASACCFGGGCCYSGCGYGGGCCYSSCYSSCCYSSCCYSGCYSGCYYGGGGCYTGYAGGHVAHAYASTSAKATLVVNVPAEAKLIINNTPTTLTNARRVFASPQLQKGKDYYYTLKATVTRDGQPVEVTKQVTVRAGRTTEVNLDFASTVTASK